MGFTKKLFRLLKCMKQYFWWAEERPASHCSTWGQFYLVSCKKLLVVQRSLLFLGSKIRRLLSPELSCLKPFAAFPCYSWGEKKEKATASVKVVVMLFLDPPPWCWWGGRAGWGLLVKQTSAKTRLGHSHCVFMPRSSQNGSLENSGLWVWKAGWEPAHLLQRHTETLGRGIKKSFFSFFLYLVPILLLEKIF